MLIECERVCVCLRACVRACVCVLGRRCCTVRTLCPGTRADKAQQIYCPKAKRTTLPCTEQHVSVNKHQASHDDICPKFGSLSKLPL